MYNQSSWHCKPEWLCNGIIATKYNISYIYLCMHIQPVKHIPRVHQLLYNMLGEYNYENDESTIFTYICINNPLCAFTI